MVKKKPAPKANPVKPRLQFVARVEPETLAALDRISTHFGWGKFGKTAAFKWAVTFAEKSLDNSGKGS